MDKRIDELLEELYKAYPKFIEEDDLIAKGFSGKLILQAYGSQLINHDLSPQMKRKVILNSDGFLMIANLKLKKSIDEFNKSSNKWSFLLTILTAIMLIAIAFQIYLVLFYK